MLLYINGKFTMGELKLSFIFYFPVHNRPTLSISTIKHTYMYLWYPLFHAQRGRRDQHK